MVVWASLNHAMFCAYGCRLGIEKRPPPHPGRQMKKGTLFRSPFLLSVAVSSYQPVRWPRSCENPPPRSFFCILRASLHVLQRTGSLKPRSAKKSCSPPVNVNDCPQSLQVSSLSWATRFTPLKCKYRNLLTHSRSHRKGGDV